MVSQQQNREHEPSQHMKVALKGIKIHLGCPRKAPGPQAKKGGRDTGRRKDGIDIEIYATDLTNNAVKSCQTRLTWKRSCK